MDIKEFKATFDKVLQNHVKNKINQAKHLLNNEKLNKYIEYIDDFIFSGGKRIRPYCLRISYLGFGGKNEEAILNFGIMFELLHSMALVHDDVIDQSEKRHNIATVHRYINNLLGGSKEHIAEGQAILIGDLLLSWVYELRYKQTGFDEKPLFEARENVHNMIEEVILGQIIDVNMMTGETTTAEMIEKKNIYKSAGYSFMRPLLTGAILANTSEENKTNITKLGKYLGLAFQVRDDLFDITGFDKTKSIFSDIQEGQQTFFTDYIFSERPEEEGKLLKSCMNKRLNEHEIKKLQDMFANSGAIDLGKDLIKSYAKQAENILKNITFTNPSAKQGLGSLIAKISDLKI